MFLINRKFRTRKYDEKLEPIITELLSYGFGITALANALNQKEIPSLSGKKQTVTTVKGLLKRLNLAVERD